MTSEAMTSVPALISLERSDLLSINNISSLNTITVDNNGVEQKFEINLDLIPLKYYRMLESYPNMFTTEKFDKKFARNPKLCAYQRYGMTNMWRPLMILNRCASITDFDFDHIRYFNIETFTNVLSVLIAREQK